MNGELLFLGTGPSSGIPRIACTCPVCFSSDPHNKRLRPAALITLGEKKILIDAGPDYRCQALRYQINRLDGVIITHSHFDHIAGLDELRVYYLQTRKPMPVLLSEPTYLALKQKYDYIFLERKEGASLTVQLDFQVLKSERGVAKFLGLEIGHLLYEQGGMPVTGLRFGSLAYISDIRKYPETIFKDLAGVKTLIVSALRKEPSPLHFSLNEAVEFSQKVGAEKTYLTHMGHELDHDQTNALLPKGCQLAYDGLKLDFFYA